MRNRLIFLLYTAFMLATASVDAAPNKKEVAAQKQVKTAIRSTKQIDSAMPTRAIKAKPLTHKKNQKTLALIKSHSQEVAKRKKPVKQETQLALHKNNKKRFQREIVAKAIASARSQVKVQPVSAIESTLYSPGVLSAGVLVLHQHSGKIMYEKNAYHSAPIASISKVMTAMVVLDAHLPMNELLTITDEDIDRVKKTSSRLTVGTQLTRAEMLLLALMSSENRAASALSRYYPGGRSAFIQAMNRKARQLGMNQTQFFDSTGLSSKNVSTPHNLALMVTAAHQYPEIHQFSTSLQYSFVSNSTGNELTFRNTNPLTRYNEWNIGLSKTGYINEAGRCLVMQTVINNAPVIIVLLDSASKQSRINDAQRIKKWMESDPGALLHAG